MHASCAQCGKAFKGKITARFCSRKCVDVSRSRIANPHWANNIVKLTAGYLGQYCPGHPKANSRGYVRHHRLVMERHLGRLLTDDEVIHHRDGDKTNNALENLQLLGNPEHVSLHTTGSLHPCAKLNEEQVREIRRRRAQGESSASLAQYFGVHASTVRKTVAGNIWRHVR